MKVKSRSRTALVVLLLLILAGTRTEGYTQNLALTVRPEETSFSISLAIERYEPHDLLSSLADGLRAEISYRIRIYRKAGGFLRFMGDRLIEEANPRYEAKWDIFSRRYIIEDDHGVERSFLDHAEFLDHFFSFPDYRVNGSIQDPSLYYVLAQSNIQTMKIVPPLNFLSILFSPGTATTPWTRGDFIASRAERE